MSYIHIETPWFDADGNTGSKDDGRILWALHLIGGERRLVTDPREYAVVLAVPYTVDAAIRGYQAGYARGYGSEHLVEKCGTYNAPEELGNDAAARCRYIFVKAATQGLVVGRQARDREEQE